MRHKGTNCYGDKTCIYSEWETYTQRSWGRQQISPLLPELLFCAFNTTTGCNGPTTKTTTVYGGDRKWTFCWLKTVPTTIISRVSWWRILKDHVQSEGMWKLLIHTVSGSAANAEAGIAEALVVEKKHAY